MGFTKKAESRKQKAEKKAAGVASSKKGAQSNPVETHLWKVKPGSPSIVRSADYWIVTPHRSFAQVVGKLSKLQQTRGEIGTADEIQIIYSGTIDA